jgi:putative ABC transport system permease protein
MMRAIEAVGMVIGVGAVIALLTIGNGAQTAVLERFSSVGTDVLYVRPGSRSQGGVQQGAGTAATLTLEDAEAPAASGAMPAVAAVAPVRNAGGQLVYQGASVNTRILGTTPAWTEVRSFRVVQGEFFDVQAMDARSAVAVLGANIAQTLFGERRPRGHVARAARSTASSRKAPTRSLKRTGYGCSAASAW